MRRGAFWIVSVAVQGMLPAAWGWGAHVHRAISYLALDGLPAEAPPWLREPEVRRRIAFQSNQPDRWRGWKADVLRHENDPDHYLDVELLEQFGLTLETIPRLRREYLRTLAVAKHAHPDNVEPYDVSKDPARTQEWPGFVLHAVAEHYAKLQAAFNQVRILERLNDPARQFQLDEARAIAIYHIGALSHFIADIAQPLHATQHFDGWVGDNPAGYQWRPKFHAYIDEGFADRHELDYDALKPHARYDAKVDAADPWKDVLAYVRRAHAQMAALYALERDQKLDGPEGERLVAGQLADATAMLSALIWAAYATSEPTDRQVETWVRYDAFNAREPADFRAPTSLPARVK